MDNRFNRVGDGFKGPGHYDSAWCGRLPFDKELRAIKVGYELSRGSA